MNYRQNGDSFSYNIIVSNGSPYADTNVVTVIDALPAGLAYSSVEKTQGSWNAGTLTWTIPSLPGKTATQLKLWVTVTDITEGPFAITYDVTGTLTDVDLSNNTKTLTATQVVGAPDAGGVNDIKGTLEIDVAENDTKCTYGDTEYRLDEDSIVNGTLVSWDEETGIGIFKPIDPTLDITAAYSLWCVVGVDEFEKSPVVTIRIKAQLDNKNIFDHKISSVPYADLTNDDKDVLELQYSEITLSDYCWRLIKNADGITTSGEPIDCDESADNKIFHYCSVVYCEDIANDCPGCPLNQLPADIQALLTLEEDYTAEIGDSIEVQHPNATSSYQYTELGWVRNACGCVLKISADEGNILTLGTDNAPYINPETYFAALGIVEENQDTLGSPRIVDPSENGKTFTNTLLNELNYYILPAASPGLKYNFSVIDEHGIRIKVDTDDYIHSLGTLSSSGGYIISTTPGAYITLIALNETLWVAFPVSAGWLVDTLVPSTSPTPTPTVTPTNTVTPTITPTVTATPSITPTETATPTVTPSISITSSVTPTVTRSVTPTVTPSPV